jgi:hypothetical protein
VRREATHPVKEKSMTHSTSTQRSRTLCAATLTVIAIALGSVALTASPAQARDEFQNGFEDQIGRMLAFEAYRVGRVVLGGGFPYATYRGGYDDDYGYYGRPREERHYYYERPRYRRPKHIHHHHHHYGRDRDCDDVEYRYEARRDRHGEVVRERYRSRGDDDRYDSRGYWRY